jgi:hypothetical protein
MGGFVGVTKEARRSTTSRSTRSTWSTTSWDALDALITAGKEVLGDPYPLTANTLVGVAALWLPELLVEIEAVAVV